MCVYGSAYLKKSDCPKTFGQRPNGTGTISYLEEQGQPSPEGVFKTRGAAYKAQYQQETPTSRPYTWMTSDFSLQQSNAIYGSSIKVQPSAFQALMIIKN